MLKIQEFILAHDDWEELLSNAPYNLKISWDDDFVLFKYSQIDSDFNEEICREARGLILDARDNFKAVRMAFKKFFNLGESFAATIDWDTAVATEKIDGSIMSVWYARGEWHLSTNGLIDASKGALAEDCPYRNFRELFESVLPLSWFEDKISNYLTGYCYTFELVSPHNKIVINYPETKVYLLSVRNMNTLKECPLNSVLQFAERFNLNTPQVYYLNNEDEFHKLVEDMPEGHEGIVIRDINNERVKIKTLLYFQLHKAKNNGVITLDRIVDLIRANDHYEFFLSYFPEYTDMFNSVRQQLYVADNEILNIRNKVQEWKQEHADVIINDPRMARRWFACDVANKTRYATLYFAEYDERLKNMLISMPTSKFISLFKIELPKEEN